MSNQLQQALIEKFETRQAHVAVIGMGYVGLPLAVAFAKAGYRVTGIDVDPEKTDAINRGESYIEDVPSGELARFVRKEWGSGEVGSKGVEQRAIHGAGEVDAAAAVAPALARPNTPTQLSATTDYAVIAECDAVSICVPTPLNKTGDPNVSYIINAAQNIARYMHPGLTVVLESTTYPGTTREVVLPILEQGLRDYWELQDEEAPEAAQVGEQFFLAFSPERIDPGRKDWTVETMPKVMGGVTEACVEVASTYYRQAMPNLVPVSSPDAAELVKLFENTFRSVNIGLANELLLICDKLGLDAWEVIEAAATKPFGFMKFTPGPGLGGHCIPVDPHYLSWKLRTVKYNARFIELASEINTAMPAWWVQRVQDALNEHGKPLKGSAVLVLGVAYKKNVSDLRESPAMDIIHLLQEKGANVLYHDPHVPNFRYEGLEMSRVEELDLALSEIDCVIIATDHDEYDWTHVARLAPLVVDTRHVLNKN